MSRLLLCAALACALSPGADTALDRYVRTPDAAYRYELVNVARAGGVSMYTLDMVSQRWLTEAEVDRPEWRHWLTVLRPDEPASSTALLLIDGGSNGSRAPTAPDAMLAAFVLSTRTVVAHLRMVPNQPLRFAGEDGSRGEDSLIAHTWAKFLETGDDRWPARLPMTKAAVRAMDAVTSFCASPEGGGVKVDRFVVAGASKRGWTAWTTAAVDRRVAAVIPMVIDTLNVEASMIHHWRAYGFWAPAIRDYAGANLMPWLGTPEWRRLMEIEDPYSYRDRLMIPKLIVNSSGDQFFLPDSSRFYFDDLPGEKYLRYVPNTDHGLESPELLPDLLAFYQALLACAPRPRFSWRADRVEGTITVKTLDEPSRVLLWQATNPEGRDFRVEKIGRVWRSTPVAGADGTYSVKLAAPEKGFTAAFVELTFPGPGAFPFRFTTDVVVAPDTYPFEAPGP